MNGRPLYLLDTTIVTELVKPQPDVSVLEGFAIHEGRMALPALVWQELLFGVARLPDGPRRYALRAFLLDILAPELPVLPYDDHAAWVHADLRAAAEARGHVAAPVEAEIAAIAIANNLILVTRDIPNFCFFRGLMRESWFAA